MATVTVLSDFGAQEKLCHGFHFSPIYLPWNDGTRCHDFFFFPMLSLKQLFHSPFTFIKRLFNSSSLSGIRVISSAFLILLIFVPAILIPFCDLSSPLFSLMYSGYKLNKQGENMQSWHTPFPILNQSMFHVLFCCFLSCIQVSHETVKVVWYSHLFKNFPQFAVIHTVKDFSVVNEVEVDFFFWNSLASSLSICPLTDGYVRYHNQCIWYSCYHILTIVTNGVISVGM